MKQNTEEKIFLFEYKVVKNELGRLIIEPTENTDLGVIEHKFMALEVARSIFYNTIEGGKDTLPEHDLYKMKLVYEGLTETADFHELAIRDKEGIMEGIEEILKKPLKDNEEEESD